MTPHFRDHRGAYACMTAYASDGGKEPVRIISFLSADTYLDLVAGSLRSADEEYASNRFARLPSFSLYRLTGASLLASYRAVEVRVDFDVTTCDEPINMNGRDHLSAEARNFIDFVVDRFRQPAINDTPAMLRAVA
jgi:hypothetical protein